MIVDEKIFCFGCEQSGSRLFFDKRGITLLIIYQDLIRTHVWQPGDSSSQGDPPNVKGITL